MKKKNNYRKQNTDQKKIPEMASFMIIVFAILYTAGWSFAYHYFGHFNVGLSALELPKEDYFIYSYWVISDHKGKLFFGTISLLVITCGCAYMIRQCIKMSSIRIYLYCIALPIVILSVFAVSYRLGTATALHRFIAQREAYYPDYHNIEIFQTSGATPKQLTQSLTSGCYRQLIQNKDKVFIFKPIKSVPQADVSTLVIPISQVHSMRLLPIHKRCD
jgi:hypothetical protein